MEAVQVRGGLRPVLTVVADTPKFAALPHEVIRDTRLSRDARLLYAVLQMHWWQDGACWASHGTLAAEMGCSPRALRTYLDELIAGGLVIEEASGQRRAKVYRPADPMRRNVPIARANTSISSDCQESNRQESTRQSARNDTSNTSKRADSYKKTPEKKTPEEDSPPSGEGAAGAATAATATKDQAAILRGLSAEARAILDWHRQCHGRRLPAKLTPEAALFLEAAVADLGVERIRESVQFMARKIPAVPELSKAINAARTKRQRDESGASPANYRNGGAPAPSAPRPGSLAARTKSERFGG